ncbi:MAG: hypothetical protein EBV53_15440 [Proteobacteria bacterium]|nr:hypothetical protein [Pseudomonadota bacterium]
MTTDTLSVHQDHNAVRPHSLGPPQIDCGPFGSWQSYRQSAANSDDVEERLCELQIIADQSFKVSLAYQEAVRVLGDGAVREIRIIEGV